MNKVDKKYGKILSSEWQRSKDCSIRNCYNDRENSENKRDPQMKDIG